ncbi:MAG: sensor histidine kinase [Enterocloster sp.]
MENEYTSQMLASQAEIHALQSQINPHFLYNTLDTIRSMAIIRDSEDIAQMAEVAVHAVPIQHKQAGRDGYS